MLKHPDGSDLIEVASELAVVHSPDGYAVPDAKALHAIGRKLELMRAQRASNRVNP